MTKILITGGTGLVGQTLSKKLVSKGYEVSFLTRTKTKSKNYFLWNIHENYIEERTFEGINHVIHLAGENIASKRWSSKQKRKIAESRINSSKLLIHTLKGINHKVESITSASGVGYYGTLNCEHEYNEKSKPGNDFLSYVCENWETEVNKAQKIGVRTVNIRTGLVLSDKGGAFPKISYPIKFGLGATLGSGNQFMPWIHLDDLCDVYIESLENKLFSGPINAVAPEVITNKQFTITVAQHLNKTIALPNIPSILLKILFGEMSSLLLKGNRVQSDTLHDLQFKFKYKTLKQAITELL